MKEQIMHDLELFLADNCQSWILHGDGSYERLSVGSKKRVCAHESFIESLASPSQGLS
jgi:polyphosphate kinase